MDGLRVCGHLGGLMCAFLAHEHPTEGAAGNTFQPPGVCAPRSLCGDPDGRNFCVIHLAVAGRYDIFRNELYFIVCGWRPAFGYVDQPPLAPLVAAATQAFGENVWLLRLPAAFAATALVPLTAAFARLLGGDRIAWILAAAAAALSPGLAALTTTTTTSTFEPIAWTACAYFLTRGIVKRDDGALFWAAIVAGIATETKYGVAIWPLGLALGLLLTEARAILAQRSYPASYPVLASKSASPDLQRTDETVHLAVSGRRPSRASRKPAPISPRASLTVRLGQSGGRLSWRRHRHARNRLSQTEPAAGIR